MHLLYLTVFFFARGFTQKNLSVTGKVILNFVLKFHVINAPRGTRFYPTFTNVFFIFVA